jgi:hypothetical protein
MPLHALRAPLGSAYPSGPKAMRGLPQCVLEYAEGTTVRKMSDKEEQGFLMAGFKEAEMGFLKQRRDERAFPFCATTLLVWADWCAEQGDVGEDCLRTLALKSAEAKCLVGGWRWCVFWTNRYKDASHLPGVLGRCLYKRNKAFVWGITNPPLPGEPRWVYYHTRFLAEMALLLAWREIFLDPKESNLNAREFAEGLKRRETILKAKAV